MEKVLFLANDIYLNPASPEGGVKICTQEFISLLAVKFDVVQFAVKTTSSLSYRVKVKLGINWYNDYDPAFYLAALKKIISESNIRFVFLNLSNTIRFAGVLKNAFGDAVKIILCSHGNDTGDYLHQVVRFSSAESKIKKALMVFTLGKRLEIETDLRIKYLDMVLSVSPVEEQIEKWIGAKEGYMVHRTVQADFLTLTPTLNRVGFIGGLNHPPNVFGITSLCDALMAVDHSITLVVIGGPADVGNALQKKYPFIEYCGFLPEEALRKEVATWAWFLNLVFYYSGGVSTKLAKALSWGLPVLSTVPGNRGYLFKDGHMDIAGSATAMAAMLTAKAGNMEAILLAQEQTKKMVASSITLSEIMDGLYPALLSL